MNKQESGQFVLDILKKLPIYSTTPEFKVRTAQIER